MQSNEPEKDPKLLNICLCLDSEKMKHRILVALGALGDGIFRFVKDPAEADLIITDARGGEDGADSLWKRHYKPDLGKMPLIMIPVSSNIAETMPKGMDSYDPEKPKSKILAVASKMFEIRSATP
ncbi:MAG: hypothetical protein JWO73_95 [Candidatus Taylorbacteria bacterium]|nr:hypothetical protein [Candidatus Taylorbacteria bacterium]